MNLTKSIMKTLDDKKLVYAIDSRQPVLFFCNFVITQFLSNKNDLVDV